MRPLNTPPPRYTETKAYDDLQAALVAIGRHVKLSGNKKLIYHLLVLEAFRDVAVKVLDQTDPEVLRAAARDFEIKARLGILG